jgi:Sec-independent protein translocase protein TatA
MVSNMTEMTKWQWFWMTWISQVFWSFIPMGIFGLLLFGLPMLILGPATMWILPWLKWGPNSSKDFPSGSLAASQAVKIGEIDIGEAFKFLFNMVLIILDMAQTPGGLKIDEDAIESWRTSLNDEGSWLTTKWDIYWWDYLRDVNFYIIQNREDIVANEGGDYMMSDLLIDILTVVGAVVLIVFLSKKGSAIATQIAGIFKKQRTKKRRKASVQRERDTLIRLDELSTKMKNLELRQLETLSKIKDTQDLVIVRDLNVIKKKRLKNRL